MKIIIKKGRQFDGDRLISIKTKEEECFNLARWYLLTNQLSFNEANKYERALQSGNRLWFQDATQEMIEYGKQGVDFLDKKNEDLLEKFCDKWKINFDLIKQTILNDFEKEENETQTL